MSQCKPCITIRDYVKIVWNNSKQFVSNVRADIRSYSRVNATVCELDRPLPPLSQDMAAKYQNEVERKVGRVNILDLSNKLKNIRETALENYNPEQIAALLATGDAMDEDKGYSIGTKEAHEEFVKKRNYNGPDQNP